MLRRKQTAREDEIAKGANAEIEMVSPPNWGVMTRPATAGISRTFSIDSTCLGYAVTPLIPYDDSGIKDYFCNNIPL